MKKILAWGVMGINGNLCQITLQEKNAGYWRRAGIDVVELVERNDDEKEIRATAPDDVAKENTKVSGVGSETQDEPARNKGKRIKSDL